MPNKNVILIARTAGDPVTRYAFYWAEVIKKEAELLGLEVIDLQNKSFDEKRMEKLIKEYDPFLVFLNGHGTQYSIKGYDGKTDVVLRCKNDHLFKNRIVYALSCHSALILGKSAYNKGCKCYIGYTDRVIFPTRELNDVLSDPVSEPFMRVSNEIILTIIKGGSPEEAVQNSLKLANELIDYWKKQDKPEALFIQRWLKQIKKELFMHS